MFPLTPHYNSVYDSSQRLDTHHFKTFLISLLAYDHMLSHSEAQGGQFPACQSFTAVPSCWASHRLHFLFDEDVRQLALFLYVRKEVEGHESLVTVTAFRLLATRDTYTDNTCVHVSMPPFDLMMPLNERGEPQLP